MGTTITLSLPWEAWGTRGVHTRGHGGWVAIWGAGRYERESYDRGFYLKKKHDFKPTDKSYLDAVRPPKSPRSSPRTSRTPSPRAAAAAPAPA